MTARHCLLPLFTAAASILVAPLPVLSQAATNQYWNPGGSGGDGIWGTGLGEKNWNTTPGAATGNISWPDTSDDVAVFQDTTGGIVTVFDPVQAAGIIQDGANYSINAGSITLVQDSATNKPFINVQSGAMTIDSVINGSAGLIKSGTGDLVLSATNTYIGTTSIAFGSLTLTGDLASVSVNIASGGRLLDESGGLTDNTALANDGGTLTLSVAETVTTYTQDNDGILNGPAILTTTTGATLNGGEIAGNLDGETLVRGEVLISGRTSGGTLTVIGGSLTLTGTADNPLLDIQAGTLVLSGDNIADTSEIEVQSGATMQVNGDDTTSRLTIRGTLDGPGILTSTHYSLFDGAVINGHLGEGDLHLYPGRGGTVTVNGTLAMDDVHNKDGTLVLSGDNLDDTSALQSSSGTIQLHGPETVESLNLYFSELGGSGTLTATNGASLGASATVSGNLLGDITVDAFRNVTVLVSGTIGGGSLDIARGPMHLTGTSTNSPVSISNRATLIDDGDLSNTAEVTNAGELQIDTNDTIGTYASNGGTLSGTGRLTAVDGATLTGLSSVTGRLTADTTMHDSSFIGASGLVMGDLTSAGSNILIEGITQGGFLDVTGGILTVTGSAFNPVVTIRSGAQVMDQSANAFADTSDVSNGGLLVLNGTETVGSYRNLSGGSLEVTVTSPTQLDRLVAGTVALEPSSSLLLARSDLTLGEVADIIDGSITGTFSLIEARSGLGQDLRYGFNQNDGTIQGLPGPAYPTSNNSNTLFNLNRNQTQVIGTVFEDTHLDPTPAEGEAPTGNFHRVYYRDTGDPTLRWEPIPASQADAASASVYDLDPGNGRAAAVDGSQAALMGEAITQFQESYDLQRDRTGEPVLDPTGTPITIVTDPGLRIANHLSPEVHQGMADFTRQTMRSQMRSAMVAPPLATAGEGQVFASLNSTGAGSSSTAHNASYNIDADGVVAGMRYRVMPNLQLGGLLGSVDGSIEGNLVDTDASGMVLGVFGEYAFGAASRTTIFSSLSYGNYDYDAARRSFGGTVRANGIDSSAWEFALGIESIVVNRDQFRLIPRGSLRYLNGDVDRFRESGPGVEMAVKGFDIDSVLLEFGIDAEVDLNERNLISAHLGFLTDLKDSRNSIRGSYVGGETPVSVHAPGIDADAIVFGLGSQFSVNEALSFGLNWRSEFRNSSQDTHIFSLGGSIDF